MLAPENPPKEEDGVHTTAKIDVVIPPVVDVATRVRVARRGSEGAATKLTATSSLAPSATVQLNATVSPVRMTTRDGVQVMLGGGSSETVTRAHCVGATKAGEGAASKRSQQAANDPTLAALNKSERDRLFVSAGGGSGLKIE
jgi:hypothetical protein